MEAKDFLVLAVHRGGGHGEKNGEKKMKMGMVEGISRGWEKKRRMKERVARLQWSQDQHSDKV